MSGAQTPAVATTGSSPDSHLPACSFRYYAWSTEATIGKFAISIRRLHQQANVVTINNRDIVIIAIIIFAGIVTIDNSDIVNVSISYDIP